MRESSKQRLTSNREKEVGNFGGLRGNLQSTYQVVFLNGPRAV